MPQHLHKLTDLPDSTEKAAPTCQSQLLAAACVRMIDRQKKINPFLAPVHLVFLTETTAGKRCAANCAVLPYYIGSFSNLLEGFVNASELLLRVGASRTTFQEASQAHSRKHLQHGRIHI